MRVALEFSAAPSPPLWRSPPTVRYPIFESWFFACVPGSPLVTAWRDEFMQLQKHRNANMYIADLRAQGVDLQNLGVERSVDGPRCDVRVWEAPAPHPLSRYPKKAPSSDIRPWPPHVQASP